MRWLGLVFLIACSKGPPPPKPCEHPVCSSLMHFQQVGKVLVPITNQYCTCPGDAGP